MVCNVPWALIIHTSVGTPLNSPMCSWVRSIHHCTRYQARGSHPYWSHNTPRMYHVWMDGNWHTSCSYLVYCVVQVDVTSCSYSHTDLNTPLSSSMWSWVRLICHCTINQSRESCPYWSHNTPRMDQHRWMKTDILLALAWDGVWCTMSSNYPCRHWHPSQFISGYMGGDDTQL